jgi:hypothetical protein
MKHETCQPLIIIVIQILESFNVYLFENMQRNLTQHCITPERANKESKVDVTPLLFSAP